MLARYDSPKSEWHKHVAAMSGAASGIAASALTSSEPHKYGIGLITGCVICFAITKVLNFVDRRTG